MFFKLKSMLKFKCLFTVINVVIFKDFFHSNPLTQEPNHRHYTLYNSSYQIPQPLLLYYLTSFPGTPMISNRKSLKLLESGNNSSKLSRLREKTRDI